MFTIGTITPNMLTFSIKQHFSRKNWIIFYGIFFAMLHSHDLKKKKEDKHISNLSDTSDISIFQLFPLILKQMFNLMKNPNHKDNTTGQQM